jgi:subtilisin family serine protease
VRAEPNYVAGRDPERDPASVKGNPWSVGGSPWSVGGSSAASDTSAAASFLDQWAFGPAGVGLFDGVGEKRMRTVTPDGTDVQVAIFDTSPFTASGLKTIDWITPTLKLDVLHPTLWSSTKLPVPSPAVVESDHGLFVAGIIHALAPASEIRLVRVLDQYGQGDLFTLCNALHDFIRGQVLLGRRGVINLSLGIFPPPNAVAQGLPKELSALETAILAAEGAGITVAAASGNQAASVLPLPAQQLPAGYDTVIGVAGSTSGRGRSCFSNPGDLAAPGGDGLTPGCTPKLDNCEGSCDLAIISLTATKASPGDGYVYWLGTSFAAPFASGAAALLLDQADGKIAPGEVRARIAAGATRPNLPTSDTSLGAGIISLTQVLYPYRLNLMMVVR